MFVFPKCTKGVKSLVSTVVELWQHNVGKIAEIHNLIQLLCTTCFCIIKIQIFETFCNFTKKKKRATFDVLLERNSQHLHFSQRERRRCKSNATFCPQSRQSFTGMSIQGRAASKHVSSLHSSRQYVFISWISLLGTRTENSMATIIIIKKKAFVGMCFYR